MDKMRKKHLWSKFVNQQCTTKMTHHHRQVLQSSIFVIGCTHTKDINA